MNRLVLCMAAGLLLCACSKSEPPEEATGDKSGTEVVVAEESPGKGTPGARPAVTVKTDGTTVVVNKDGVATGDVKVDKDGVTTGGVKVDKDGVTTGGVKVDKDGVTTGGVKVGSDGKIVVPGVR